jgi:aryl-alcohol dehydrogenase-like predicted oxidoreductase/enamine deaminase RidA (YjgF/YER057c/UK114 family)
MIRRQASYRLRLPLHQRKVRIIELSSASANPPRRCELAPGFSISPVLTGLWQIADMERDDRLDLEAAAAAMKPYAEAGLTTFDMADHYGSAEEIAGIFRRQHGSGDVQLLTKWVPKPGPITRQDVRAGVERSLRRLQTPRLDLLQFHAWSYADPSWLDGLFYLQELREEGLVAHLGLTNVDTAHLRIALLSGIEIVSNQVCYSLLDQRAGRAMTDLCLEHGVHLLAYGTLAGGLLTERWLGKAEPAEDDLKTWSQMKYRRFIDVAGGWEAYQALLRTVDEVARAEGVSMANIACRYILEKPAVGGVIIGARLGESEHVEDSRRLLAGSLNASSRSALDEALGALAPIPGDCGDEYRRPPFLTASGDLSHHFGSIPPPMIARTGEDGRMRVSSGTPWEEMAGYCRAVRHGERILVSGTTANHGDRGIGGCDPAAQFHFVIDKIEGAIQSLGGRLEDVVRTRVFIHNLDDWEAVARAHGERFRDILPANTLVQAALVGEGNLVEVEAEALRSLGHP